MGEPFREFCTVGTEREVNGIKLENPFLHYRKLELIGEGEYGKVYKAMDQRNGQVAAVKVIDMDRMYDNNEVEFMQNINHHNITNLIEVYYWDKLLYVFIEFCSGTNLCVLCFKTGPFNEQEIAYVTKECLQGLHYMHGRGYMHRDIKLENILLNDTGEVKICDFGLVEKMENETNEIAGTEETRAPEVSMAEECGAYDERCDIWSLGISVLDLAECMSLVTYESDKVYQSWITKTKKIWSEDFKSFVRAALTENPSRRPTAEELLNHSFILSVQSGQSILKRLQILQRFCEQHNVSNETIETQTIETETIAKQISPEKHDVSHDTEMAKEAQQSRPEYHNVSYETEMAKEPNQI
uniref:non-specific serine/threonine protein kinase n=1 Tax=Denticeps clupeoides TaxID=299321 RepID=A0AAY3ZUP7_9TELE